MNAPPATAREDTLGFAAEPAHRSAERPAGRGAAEQPLLSALTAAATAALLAEPRPPRPPRPLDVLRVPAPELPTTRAVLTLVGGRVAFDAGVPSEFGPRAEHAAAINPTPPP